MPYALLDLPRMALRSIRHSAPFWLAASKL
jgi:hypothetical protein